MSYIKDWFKNRKLFVKRIALPTATPLIPYPPIGVPMVSSFKVTQALTDEILQSVVKNVTNSPMIKSPFPDDNGDHYIVVNRVEINKIGELTIRFYHNDVEVMNLPVGFVLNDGNTLTLTGLHFLVPVKISY